MLSAMTRRVSPRLGECELSYLSRECIDAALAAEQHHLYERKLDQLGVRVHSLPPLPDQPDCTFVEDPAVVVDEVAVITTMGIASRRGERESLARALSDFRPLRFMSEPALLEGGDVVRVGRTLYVGLSGRTDLQGHEQLRDLLAPFDYQVRGVEVRECLHLKTGCSYLGRGVMLVYGDWVNVSQFEGLELLEVPREECWAANALALGETIIMPEGFARTRALIEERGFRVETLQVSELMKAEAGLTCMSIIFKS